jgi:hypothetical protein
MVCILIQKEGDYPENIWNIMVMFKNNITKLLYLFPSYDLSEVTWSHGGCLHKGVAEGMNGNRNLLMGL